MSTTLDEELDQCLIWKLRNEAVLNGFEAAFCLSPGMDIMRGVSGLSPKVWPLSRGEAIVTQTYCTAVASQCTVIWKIWLALCLFSLCFCWVALADCCLATAQSGRREYCTGYCWHLHWKALDAVRSHRKQMAPCMSSNSQNPRAEREDLLDDGKFLEVLKESKIPSPGSTGAAPLLRINK